MIDVVYPLGTGSKWKDLEFVFSLRSLHKYLKNFRRVIVVGELPRTVGDAPAPQFLPYKDLTGCKQTNVRRKLEQVRRLGGVTEEFLLMNDDFFFCRPVDALEIPYHRSGTMAQHVELRENIPSAYTESLKETYDWLRTQGYPTNDFEVHVPIRYTKAGLSRVFGLCNFPGNRGGLLRSLFANIEGHPGVASSDVKIAEPLDEAEVRRRIANRDYFSVGDGGTTPTMKRILATL